MVVPGISLLNLPTSGFGPAIVDIDGNSYETLGELKPGVKALLIVNVASK